MYFSITSSNATTFYKKKVMSAKLPCISPKTNIGDFKCANSGSVAQISRHMLHTAKTSLQNYGKFSYLKLLCDGLAARRIISISLVGSTGGSVGEFM